MRLKCRNLHIWLRIYKFNFINNFIMYLKPDSGYEIALRNLE